MVPSDEKKEALCPICDSKVAPDAKKCPECKADLTLFGVKTGDEDLGGEIEIPDEESIEALLGEIGKKNGKKEHELFDEIMAAVDKSEVAGSQKEMGEPLVDEKIEEVVEEVVSEEAEPKEQVMFECPLCNTLVSEDARSCPSCRAQFAESEEEAASEEVPQQEVRRPEAPKTEAARERAAPPAAGLEEEKAQRKELTQCVGEVKPLLAGARQFGINVMDGRKLIDSAIAAGKNRDFKNAINLVKSSQKAIENNFRQHVEDTVSVILTKIDAIRKAGGDTAGLDGMVSRIKVLQEKKNYIEAATLARTASERTEASILKLKSALKEKHKDEGKSVNEKVEDLVDLIKSGEEVKVNVKGAITLLTQARLAIKKSEYKKAEEYLIQAKEDFLKELPKQITEIISNSKPMLYKAKMQGVDIRPSIKLLKEASTALKLNNYIDALNAIKRYRVEMNQYMGEK